MSSQVRVTTRPLKERLLNASVRSPATSKPSTAATQFCSRMKYKQYDESKLYQAYRDVVEGKLSTRRAALEYGVPLSTLSDRLTGKVQFGKKGGAEKYLTDSEELELKNFIVKLAALGFGFGRKEIIALVQDLLDKRGVNKTITHGWWDGFRRRHPDIVLRQPEPISKVRYLAFNSEIIESYFKELECTLLDNDILEQPSLIFNMDETGFPLNPKSTFVACKRGEKHPSFITSGGKSHITVLACCSASGNAIPPLVIFEGKIFKEELAAGEIPGTMYALSKSGWIDSEIFDLWFTDHFLPHAPGGRPILLLLDGHSSHYNPETINRAAEEKIIIFCLPPHTSHRTQPLDKGCFSPLKSCWREECHTYLRNNPGKIITRFQFSTIFARAWMRSMSMKNITSGFKTTGIYPFNPRALQPEVEKVSPLFNPASLCEKTGINYIPLYSPHRKFRHSDHHHTIPNNKSVDSLPESPIFSPKSTIPVVPRSLDDSSFGDTICNCSKTSFTLEEIAIYQRRFDEGYDIPDERYELWLKQNKPTHHMKESTPLEDSNDIIHLSYRSTFSTFLKKKVPEVKVPNRTATKATSRVLTSAQNRKNMEEKRVQKEKEKAIREERKAERERRKLEREAAARQKQLKKRCNSKANDKKVPNSSPSPNTTSSPVKTRATRLKSSKGTSSLVNTVKRATNSKVSATTVSATVTTAAKFTEDSSLPRVTKNTSCNTSQSSSLSSVGTRATKRRSLIPVPTSTTSTSIRNQGSALCHTLTKASPNVSNQGTRSTAATRATKRRSLIPVPTSTTSTIIRNQGSALCHTRTKTRPTCNVSNQVDCRGTSSNEFNDSLSATAHSESYCWCGGPEKGRMVACDNNLCDKQWFHYECAGIRRAPRGAWYCSEECREKC